MAKTASGLCAFGLMAMAGWAQQGPPDPAAVMDSVERQIAPLADAWLHSADPRVQAWGAYVALRDRRTAAIPTLLDMLSGYAGGGDAQQHDAMLAVLDAIIEMGVAAPVADAQRIYAEFPVQALILLSRSNEDTAAALLDIFKTERSQPAGWLAAGNLLLEHRVPDFAAAVVEGLTVHALVTVREPNTGGGSGGGSACNGLGGRAMPKAGWPPVGVYGFAGCGDHMQPGARVLAGGTDPAYYMRQVNASYQMDGSAGCCGVCRPDEDLVRQHYLTTLLSASAESPPVRAHVAHTIVWQGADAYRAELEAFIAGQQQIFAEMARRLGLGDLRPALEVRIWDQRAAQQPPLPAAARQADNVTIEPLR